MRTPSNERLTSDIDGPDLPAAAGSERRCILTGASSAREGLVRLAISPDGLVLPDVAGKAPGRGAWVTPDRALLEVARAEGSLRKALMRAFKGATLTIPDDLANRVEAALERQLAERLGLELRSGNIVMGSARIEEQARGGRIAVLLHASDSSADGRRKLDQAWRVGREAEGSGERGVVLPLDRTALSVALGRDNVVHLGVAGYPRDPRAAERVLHAVTRLMAYLGSHSPRITNETGQDASGHSDQPTSGPVPLDEFVKD